MRAIALLYLRELRGALRERTLVVYSLLIPLLLYPTMMWLALTGLTFVQGQAEGQPARIQLVGLPEAHEGLATALAADEHVELSRAETRSEAREALAAAELDLVVGFGPPPAAELVGRGELADNFGVELLYDGSSDRSLAARGRLEQTLAQYRDTWLQREALARGVDERAWQGFAIAERNHASDEEMGALLLGQLAPLTILIMVALGAMYPAIDSTAGERERSTWETSLTLGVSRRQLVLAKYLYVATLSAVAGLLNMVGIALGLGAVLRQFAAGGFEVGVPWAALPVVLLGVALLALLLAGAMMLVAAFAKSFREGQSLVSPLFMVVMLPVMIATLPPEAIGPGFAAIPLVNVMIVFEQALTASIAWDFLALTAASSALAVVACLWLATALLRNEELVLGSFSGTASEYMTRLLRPRGGGREEHEEHEDP